MADKDIRYLVRDACRQTAAITQIKQHTAALMAHAQMEQRIAKHTIDQGHVNSADATDYAWAIIDRNCWQHVVWRQVVQVLGSVRLRSFQITVDTAGGVTYQQGIGVASFSCQYNH